MQKNYDNLIEGIDLDYDRLLKNANEALENSKTPWSKNYWGLVIAQLERRSKELILNWGKLWHSHLLF